MKLRFSPASPFARKCAIAGHALGLADRLEMVDGAGDPGDAIRARNPLGKIPLLLTDDGDTVFDSVVICEYLDHVAGGGRIIPSEPKARFRALTLQALADGVMDAAILVMYEGRYREPAQHSPRWVAMQQKKVDTSLDALETMIPDNSVHVGTIATSAMLGYLDFRFKGAWRETRPKLAAWFDGFSPKLPGFAETQPAG
ncbi:MAG: glutathione S-transferase [Hyphomicrobiales bacterium]|nr:glutathione S-transferase [Hyphomicrobiales bacterium]